MYSNLMQRIYIDLWFQITNKNNHEEMTEQFFLTHRCSTIFGQNEQESNSNDVVLQIPQTPRVEPRNQMQFNVIPRTLKVLFFPKPFSTFKIKRIGYWFVTRPICRLHSGQSYRC